MAASAMASAATSVIMCAASDSSARLLNTTAPATSATRKVVVSVRAMVSRLLLAAAPWEWPSPIDLVSFGSGLRPAQDLHRFKRDGPQMFQVRQGLDKGAQFGFLVEDLDDHGLIVVQHMATVETRAMTKADEGL